MPQQAVMIVADKNISLTLTGNGDVVEPHDGIIAVGSGGNFAPPFLRSCYSLNVTHLPFSFVHSFIHESNLLVVIVVVAAAAAFLGSFALACARGLIDVPGLDAEAIARKSMQVQFSLFFFFICLFVCLLCVCPPLFLSFFFSYLFCFIVLLFCFVLFLRCRWRRIFAFIRTIALWWRR